MRVKCQVVQDILPLYADELCSKETKALVEEHITHCSQCRKALEAMTAELTSNVTINEEELKRSRAPFAKVRRNVVLLSVFLVFITASVVLLSGFNLGFTGERHTLEIGTNIYDIDFQQLVVDMAELVGADEARFYNVMHSSIDIDSDGYIERFNLSFIVLRDEKPVHFQTIFNAGNLVISRAWDIETVKEEVQNSYRSLSLELHSQIPWDHVHANLSSSSYSRLHVTDRVTGDGRGNLWVGSGGTKAFLVQDNGEIIPLESDSLLPTSEYHAIMFAAMRDSNDGTSSRGTVEIEYFFKLR